MTVLAQNNKSLRRYKYSRDALTSLQRKTQDAQKTLTLSFLKEATLETSVVSLLLKKKEWLQRYTLIFRPCGRQSRTATLVRPQRGGDTAEGNVRCAGEAPAACPPAAGPELGRGISSEFEPQIAPPVQQSSVPWQGRSVQPGVCATTKETSLR